MPTRVAVRERFSNRHAGLVSSTASGSVVRCDSSAVMFVEYSLYRGCRLLSVPLLGQRRLVRGPVERAGVVPPGYAESCRQHHRACQWDLVSVRILVRRGRRKHLRRPPKSIRPAGGALEWDQMVTRAGSGPEWSCAKQPADQRVMHVADRLHCRGRVCLGASDNPAGRTLERDHVVDRARDG